MSLFFKINLVRGFSNEDCDVRRKFAERSLNQKTQKNLNFKSKFFRKPKIFSIVHANLSYIVREVLVMFCYGYLFGFIKLVKDSHHDEVFIERTQQVVMRNNRWLLDYSQLLAIARELGYGKVTVIDWRDIDG